MADPRAEHVSQAAADLADDLLSGDTERLAHSAAVAQQARLLAMTVDEQDWAVLVTAAWLHNIGYRPTVRQTGFHPVDGARHLRRASWPQQVQDLVAHHSGRRFVAWVRKLESSLDEFGFREDALSDAVTVADQTVGPGGRSRSGGPQERGEVPRAPPAPVKPRSLS